MNSYPHIETKSDYTKYERAVARFFEREGITNLTAEVGEDCEHACIICGEIVGCDAYFSSSACECCGRCLGGDRYHATGYNPQTREAYCYEVCVDCTYHAEYGQLDDLTMMQIDVESWAEGTEPA